MAQLILKGNLETSAILAIQNGPSSVNNSTKYFDDSSNANAGVLEVGNILYDTSDTNPSTGTVYAPGSNGWHWDETNQSAILLHSEIAFIADMPGTWLEQFRHASA